MFATSFALAARDLGFATRVVNGYYGGDWNEVGGFLLIWKKHAHSWVEVWLGGGWQRMDPTPPSRWLTLIGALSAIWWVWRRYYNRFIATAMRRRNDLVWLLLDRWLRRRGIKRRKHQPLRAISHPDEVSEMRWRVFVQAWEAQAYGGAKAWHRRDLKRHLRALLKGC